MTQNDPVLSMLGLCRRAGKLSVGTQAVTTSIKRKRARLVIVAADISPKTEKELRYTAKDSALDILRVRHSLFEVGHAIGIKAGVVSVEDEGFAKAIAKRVAAQNSASESTNDQREEFAYDD